MKQDLLRSKELLIINIVLAFAIIAMDACFIVLGIPYVFKLIGSILFVILGAVNFLFIFLYKNERHNLFKFLMMAGLVFACLGDILLIDYFIIGAILFAIGHVFFFAAYSVLSKIKWRDIIISLVLFAIGLVIILVPQIFHFGDMFAVVIVYAFIICFMLGKAISNCFEPDYRKQNIWIMVGSLLFFLSDLMLLFNVFSEVSSVFGILCLVMYYPAEILLATSIYYCNVKKEPQQIAERSRASL